MIHYWRTDTSLKLMNLLFTAGSCGLSGYCGWLLASELPAAIQIATAAIFGGIAYGLSEAVVWRTRYRLAKDREGWWRNTMLAAFLLVANLATDYSASSTLRDLAKTKTDVQNTNAANAASEVTRLQKRASEIRARTAWQSSYLAPAAYDAEVLRLKNETDRGRNIWRRSKQCTDTTADTSKRVCQSIATALANRANAQQRAGLVAEMKQVSSELKAAKAAVKETPKSANPALAPIIGLVSWARLSLSHTTSDVQWGLNAFVLMLTGVITAAIAYLSAEIGARAGPMTAAVQHQPRERPDYWGDRALPAPPGHTPIQLHAETVPDQPSNMVVNYSSTTTTARPAEVDRLMDMIRALDAKRDAA